MSDLVVIGKEKLTVAQFEQLADVPPEVEWLANITNSKTRRVYRVDVEESPASRDSQHPRNCVA